MPRKDDIDAANKDKEEGDKFETIKMDRSCTDPICCILFALFLATMVGITGYAIKNGNPLAMLTPFDSQGNQCGQPNQGPQNKTDFTDYPYKYFYNLAKVADKPTPFVLFKSQCVKTCPAKDATADCITNDGVGKGCESSMVYGTTLFKTYCLPDKDAVKEIKEQLENALNNNSAFASSVNDVQICWKVIVGMCAGTIVIALLYVFLLRWIVKPILYVSMLLILAGFILLGVWSFMQREKYNPETQKKNYDYATAGAIIGLVLAFIYLCFMCCCWHNISLGASIMEAASDFVTSNIKVVFLPIFAYLIALVFFAYWAVTAVYLYGVGDVQFNKDLPFATVKNNEQTTYIAWYFLFGLLWVVAFFICLQQFIIAALVCMWYFMGRGDDAGEVSIIKAIHWGTWYHCGSISFGAFCIAVITMIRIVFEYLAHKYEAMAGKDGTLYKIVTCFMRCVLWCLDQYVKFITKNAFIQIALQNKNFCSAAWSSFFLIVRNAGKFGSSVIIGWIIMMLGKGTIMGVSGFITVVIIKASYTEVSQPFLPAGFVVIVAYVVGSLFLSIFSFSCTAILHCFILNEDVQGKCPPPESLQPFLEHVESQQKDKPKEDKGEKYKEGTEMTDQKKEGDDAKANDVS